MIVALIVFLLVVVFMAFFFGKNLSNACNFWFFKSFTNVPVSVLVLIAFAVGIVFSILVFIIAKIKKSTESDSSEPKVKKEKPSRTKEKIEKKERKFRKNKKEAMAKDVAVKSSDDKSGADNK